MVVRGGRFKSGRKRGLLEPELEFDFVAHLNKGLQETIECVIQEELLDEIRHAVQRSEVFRRFVTSRVEQTLARLEQ